MVRKLPQEGAFWLKLGLTVYSPRLFSVCPLNPRTDIWSGLILSVEGALSGPPFGQCPAVVGFVVGFNFGYTGFLTGCQLQPGNPEWKGEGWNR